MLFELEKGIFHGVPQTIIGLQWKSNFNFPKPAYRLSYWVGVYKVKMIVDGCYIVSAIRWLRADGVEYWKHGDWIVWDKATKEVFNLQIVESFRV